VARKKSKRRLQRKKSELCTFPTPEGPVDWLYGAFRKVLGLGGVQKIQSLSADAAQVMPALRQCCYGDGCIASVLLWCSSKASEGVSDDVAEIGLSLHASMQQQRDAGASEE
jgi:hypothetical protein